MLKASVNKLGCAAAAPLQTMRGAEEQSAIVYCDLDFNLDSFGTSPPTWNASTPLHPTHPTYPTPPHLGVRVQSENKMEGDRRRTYSNSSLLLPFFFLLFPLFWSLAAPAPSISAVRASMSMSSLALKHQSKLQSTHLQFATHLDEIYVCLTPGSDLCGL